MIKVILLTIGILSICGCGDTVSNEISSESISTGIGEFKFEDPYKKARKNVIKINFQPSNSVPVEGYLIDTGLPFGRRKGGLTYGWSQDVSKGLRDRNNFKSLDKRFDTFAHLRLQKNDIDAKWELSLDNGKYLVHIVDSDPSYQSSYLSLKVENQQAVQSKLNQDGYLSTELEVIVRDGKLTIEPTKNEKGYYPKLSFVEIFQDGFIPPPLPINLKDTINLKNMSFVHWQNPFVNFHQNFLIQTAKPIEQIVSSVQELHTMKASIRSLGKASNTLINHEQNIYNYIVSSDKKGRLSTPLFLPLPSKAQPISRQQLNHNLARAMELTKRWTSNSDIFQLHNLFSEHLFTHQVNGQPNTIIEKSVWQQNSLNSAVIALQTERPAKTYVKYWNNSDTFELLTSSRPLYTHIHYLKNLKPNTSYSYEVVAEGEKKDVVLYSGTITTPSEHIFESIYPSEHRNFPISLNKPNSKYVLRGNIKTDKTAFIISAENISLDLNGYVIEQTGKSTKNLEPVIKTKGRLNRFSLFNGHITQDNKRISDNNHLISIGNVKVLELAGVTATYSLPQTVAINVTAKDKLQKPYSINIHHNQIIDKGWEVKNRHGYGSSVPIRFENSFAYYESSTEAAYNLILRSRQNGIQAATYVHHNEIYTDSWTTNSFAIQPFGTLNKTSGRFTNNKIFLTGYHAIGFGWSSNDLLVENNYIEMQGINSGRNRWWEDFGDQNSLNGLRITNYGTGGQVRKNLKYYNNKIIGMARNGSMMRGTELYSDYSISGTEVRWSEIDVRAEDSKSINVSAVVTQGTQNDSHQPTFYRDSILRSNVAIVRFGDSYGRGDNHMFENVTFEKIKGNEHFATFVFDGAFKSTGHQVIDSTFTNGAKWDDVFWRKTSLGSYFQVIDNKQKTIKTIRALEWEPELTRFPEVKSRRQTQAITEIY